MLANNYQGETSPTFGRSSSASYSKMIDADVVHSCSGCRLYKIMKLVASENSAFEKVFSSYSVETWEIMELCLHA